MLPLATLPALPHYFIRTVTRQHRVATQHYIVAMSDKVNNTPASGAAHAATASDNPNAYSIARPSTPPVDINSMAMETDSVVVPNAPRRPNRGR